MNAIFDRCQRAVDLRKQGKIYREIGEAIGWRYAPEKPLSVERARQLVCKGVRIIMHPSRKDHPDREWAESFKLPRGWQ